LFVCLFRNDVELKKYKSKYILKSAVTPQPSRRKINESSSTLDRTQSMPSVAQTGSSGYLSPVSAFVGGGG
jgi:hypothetical protein